MTIQLYGFAISNFYNKVRMAAVYKGLDLEEVRTAPGMRDEVTKFSPMGKMPWLIHGDTVVFESQPIVEYLEEQFPEPALLPKLPADRARCREIIQLVELHVDPPLRRVFFGEDEKTPENMQKAVDKVKPALAALERLGKFSPYILGSEFTMADISAAATLPFIENGYIEMGLDFDSNFPSWQSYKAELEKVPCVKKTWRAWKATVRARKMLKAKENA